LKVLKNRVVELREFLKRKGRKYCEVSCHTPKVERFKKEHEIVFFEGQQMQKDDCDTLEKIIEKLGFERMYIKTSIHLGHDSGVDYEVSSSKRFQIEVENYRVTGIKLNNFGLERIPEGIYDFGRLEFLDLTDNELREIPGGIKRIGGLRALCLEKNPLEEIPEHVSELGELRCLYIDKDVKKIPKSIGALKKGKFEPAEGSVMMYVGPVKELAFMRRMYYPYWDRYIRIKKEEEEKAFK